MEQQNSLYDAEKRRIFIVLLVIVLALAAVGGRLFWIQMVSARSYSDRNIDLVRNSVLQRQKALVLDNGRGQFVDRYLHPLTGGTLRALVVFPVQGDYQGNDTQILKLTQIMNTSVGQWSLFMKGLKEPRLWGSGDKGMPALLTDTQVEQINSLELSFLQVVEVQDRYSQSQTAAQLIGFIGQNPQRVMSAFASQYASGELKLTSEIGGSGLEKTLEPWLRGVGETSISYFTDANKRPLKGLEARLIEPHNDYYPLKVVTTIDEQLQRNIESLMVKQKVKEGSIVVLDASNADVLAMASAPSYHPESIDLNNTNWSNQAVKAIAPGSIFKTVVAAAALEEGVVSEDETFECKGALGQYGFTCWHKEGHGFLTLQEGFAKSCNIVFAQIMKRLSSTQLQDYAERLGLVTKVGWTGKSGLVEQLQQLDGEEEGQLFAGATPREDEGVRLQTAIGQRDVLVSPLQAANMVVTLLQGGERYSPRVVQEIRFHTEQVMERFSVKQLNADADQVKKATSLKLLSWMEDVVAEGTGQALQAAKWKLAGKSGTAQVQVNHQERVNQWFVGYGPIESPKYAVAVVIKNAGVFQANQAIPLFQGIMDLLAVQSKSEIN
jgi:cell division protein FtsI/penicillin-binding protein 2